MRGATAVMTALEQWCGVAVWPTGRRRRIAQHCEQESRELENDGRATPGRQIARFCVLQLGEATCSVVHFTRLP